MAAALTPATRSSPSTGSVNACPGQGVGRHPPIDASRRTSATVAEITGGAGCRRHRRDHRQRAVLRQGVDALAARGTLVVVGAPPFGTEVALDVNGMLGGKRVVGLTLGDAETQTFIPALVELVKTAASRCTA